MAKTALKAVPVTLETPTLADLMEQLVANNRLQQPFKDKLKPLEDTAKALKDAILPLMDAAGVRKGSTKTATVSITEIENVIIDDLPTMLKALKRDKWEHIISLKVAAAKEYGQILGKEIPGTHTAVISRHLRLSGIAKV